MSTTEIVAPIASQLATIIRTYLSTVAIVPVANEVASVIMVLFGIQQWTIHASPLTNVPRSVTSTSTGTLLGNLAFEAWKIQDQGVSLSFQKQVVCAILATGEMEAPRNVRQSQHWVSLAAKRKVPFLLTIFCTCQHKNCKQNVAPTRLTHSATQNVPGTALMTTNGKCVPPYATGDAFAKTGSKEKAPAVACCQLSANTGWAHIRLRCGEFKGKLQSQY